MPENDPSDGEINDVNEFLTEIGRVEYDETLIDLVGQGYDVNAPGDQAVADLLGAWRDDVGARPVDWSRFPSAATARGELPRAPTTGGTMSVQAEAERLRGLASSQDIPIEILHSAEQRLDDLQAQVREILGDVSQHLPTLEALVAEVKGALQTAIGAAKQFEDALHAAADAHARG